MKYVTSCLLKGTLSDTNILLTSKLFIEKNLFYLDEICIFQFQYHQTL